MFKMNKGFSFVEIMVIVAIIGLLLLIALPNYIESQIKSRSSICISNQKMIYTAATMYIIQGETPSLEDINGDKERLEALMDSGFLKGGAWGDCPSERNGDYDDYIMIFEGDFIADIECDRDPQHIWP